MKNLSILQWIDQIKLKWDEKLINLIKKYNCIKNHFFVFVYVRKRLKTTAEIQLNSIDHIGNFYDVKSMKAITRDVMTSSWKIHMSACSTFESTHSHIHNHSHMLTYIHTYIHMRTKTNLPEVESFKHMFCRSSFH